MQVPKQNGTASIIKLQQPRQKAAEETASVKIPATIPGGTDVVKLVLTGIQAAAVQITQRYDFQRFKRKGYIQNF